MALVRALAMGTSIAVALAASPIPLSGGLVPLEIADPAVIAGVMRDAGHAEMVQGRQFIGFDPTGDGRAIEIFGDLGTASRIVVLVPGSDITLTTFDRTAAQARALHAAAGVTTVAWLGYDPPEGLGPAAARPDRAVAGARALLHFLAALPPHATVVVVGHSYGSVVVAKAAPRFGPRVTDVVALGSPGMGASRVVDLRTRARVWIALAPNDWINRVPRIRLGGLGHGPLPVDALPLPTFGVTGHDGYLVAGSATLDAVARIALFSQPIDRLGADGDLTKLGASAAHRG